MIIPAVSMVFFFSNFSTAVTRLPSRNVKIVLFRPFAYSEVADELKGIKQIAVLDRSFSFGANAPLYGEIRNAINDPEINVHSSVFGLGGRDIFEKDIEKVFEALLSGKEPERFIGARHD